MSKTENIETEIKLIALSEDVLAGVASLPLLRERMIAGSEREKELVSHYYDTPKRRLARAGVVYRVRKEPGGYVATVKAENSNSGGLSERLEYNVPLPDADPTLAGFEHIKFLLDLPALVGKGELEKLFAVEVVRQQFEVAVTAETKVEVAIDRGKIIAGDKSLPIAEVELELIEGKRSDLLAFVAQLTKEAPLFAEHKSKYYRGWLLIGGKSDFSKSKKIEEESRQPLKDILLSVLAEKIGLLLSSITDAAFSPAKAGLLSEQAQELKSVLDFAAPLLSAPEYDRQESILDKMAKDFAAVSLVASFSADWEHITSQMSGIQPTAVWAKLLVEKQRDSGLAEKDYTSRLFSLWAWLEGAPWLNIVQPATKEFIVERCLQYLTEIMDMQQNIESSAKNAAILADKVGALNAALGVLHPQLPKNVNKLQKNIDALHAALKKGQEAQKAGEGIFSLFKASGSRLLYRDAGILYGWYLRSQGKEKNSKEIEEYLSEIRKIWIKLKKSLPGDDLAVLQED